MAKVHIEKIEIDVSGRLLVTPVAGFDFAFIYRAATGVRWDNASSSLVAPKPKDWSYLNWFENIYASVRSEYGDQLIIFSNTKWFNVPNELRREIIKGSAEIEKRLQEIQDAHREEATRLSQEHEYKQISTQAAATFRKGDYEQTVALLSNAVQPLSAVDEKKLQYARKKLKR